MKEAALLAQVLGTMNAAIEAKTITAGVVSGAFAIDEADFFCEPGSVGLVGVSREIESVSREARIAFAGALARVLDRERDSIMRLVKADLDASEALARKQAKAAEERLTAKLREAGI